MVQKHRISTKIGEDQKVVVELKQDFDLLEILSLKFTQKEIYASLCADYGVICGRITANNGLGIPNARVSIFVPLTTQDEEDPVISALYPYKITSDRNDENYRYNLLPSRKQHGGHTPTGTFFDQSDILSREEVLEVYEKYYSFTVKTNNAGDFMIWGVPVGTQTIHVDVDLSDMGCFSLRPYDFIRQGIGQDKFDRFYNFKASDDIDGLPQIVTFEKTIEVYPFWGNEELCELGITRTDFDLSDRGIKIEPIALILASTVSDDNASSIKRSGKLRKNQGYKCNLQTSEGSVECVRFTGNKIFGSDNTTLYPELEYFNITETIDQNGSIMIVLPMNMEYLYTNEFGEEEITNDSNKGIPTTTIARFKFELNFSDRKITTAKYLVPNIREYNPNASGVFNNETDENFLTTYQFSNNFEDYLTITGITPSASMSSPYKADKKKKMTGEDNNNIPEDYFYKFIFGKVYTVSSFQGSHFETSSGLSTKDAFLGIKEIRPSVENDCASSTNYFPVNFAFRNRIKFALIISQFLLFIQFLTTLFLIRIYEIVATALFYIGLAIGLLSDKVAEKIIQYALKIVEGGQTTLPLVIYPDCEPCSTDDENSGVTVIENLEQTYYRSAEVKALVIPSGPYINLVFLTGQTPTWFNTSTTSGSTFLPDLFPSDSGKEVEATGITENQLTSLDTYTTDSSDYNSNYRFAAVIYPLIGTNPDTEIFSTFDAVFKVGIIEDGPLTANFENDSSQYPTNTINSVRPTVGAGGYSVTFEYVNSSGAPVTATENISIEFLVVNQCTNARLIKFKTITSGTSSIIYDMAAINCGSFTRYESYERIVSISGSTSGANVIPQWNTNPTTTYTGPTIKFTYEEWAKIGTDYNSEPLKLLEIDNLYAVIRIYDRLALQSGFTNPEIVIEQGCSKYDKFYDESVVKTYLWAPNNINYNDPSVDYPSNYYDDGSNSGWINTSNAREYNSAFNYGTPQYGVSNFIESFTSPGANYTLLAAVAGRSTSLRLPNFVKFREAGNILLSKKTKSGLTEIRDGVITVVPSISGPRFAPSVNQDVIREWYRRKRIGLMFCAGVTNYSFIDNWLNGILYFFKFDRRIKWDNEQSFDLNKRASKYPRDLVFYNVLDKSFYYRSTPYDPTFGFKGQAYDSNSRFEILHPTTFYDIGVRDEFLKEICTDPRLDPTCSVIRDIGVTSYQDSANIVEYAINYRLDTTAATFQVEDFFDTDYLGNSIKSFDGDINQLMSINSEAGIEAFDLDSPQYFTFNGEFMDPEDSAVSSYFKVGGSYGPTPIDLKFDDNGGFVRECLNFRLGDYSQVVPFYLWDKKGQGFGPAGSNSDNQAWDRGDITSMKLQRIFSIENYGDTTTNYVFDDGEEEYLLRPMTKDHDTFVFTGNTNDNFALERFEVISDYAPDVSGLGASAYTEGDLWLHVKSGTTTPLEVFSGVTYVVKNATWTRDVDYIKDVQEIFLFTTLNNYTGNRQVLSTPFHFYFGLKPGATSLDTFIKYFGPKSPRTSIILTGTTGTVEPPAPTPSVTPSATPTSTPSLSLSPTPTPSLTPQNTAPPTPSMTATPTPTPSITPTNQPSPSVTPSNTITPSVTPTITNTPSITPSFTPTPSITPSITVTPSTSAPCACTPGDPTGNTQCIGEELYNEYYNCDCSIYLLPTGGPCF